MSNGKLLTLFLEHENELRATMPDFAHQLSELLNVPPKVVDYSKKAVAEYEVSEVEPETTNTTEELEEDLEFHEDFEKNIMFLMDQSDETMLSVFRNHFEGEENRENMMAQLADNFSYDNLQSMFQNTNNSDVKDDLLSTYISHCGVDKKKKKNDPQLQEIESESEMHCAEEKNKLPHNIKIVTLAERKKNELIEIRFCESCDASHADHFRLCDLCNEEHDGCCEIYA